MDTVLIDLTLVVVFAAALSWLAVLARQPIILAYILCGVVVAHLFRMEQTFLRDLSHVGVTLLLFLAGIALHPHRLVQLFRQTMPVTLTVCAVSAGLSFGIALAWGFGPADSALVGLALMFSSTILVVKLLPTRTLHHDRMGAMCIGILVAQDLMAVAALVVLRIAYAPGAATRTASRVAIMIVGGIGLVPAALLFEQFVLRRVLRTVYRFPETAHLVALAWCLGVGAAAKALGFSYELGGFVAGIALARCAVAEVLFEGLRTLRDFFLILFFFALGARLDLAAVVSVLAPAAAIAAALILVKPIVFHLMFRIVGETRAFASEAGLRLGQASEFGLIIIALIALELGVAERRLNELVVVATLLTMIISSYIVVFRYPTPMGTRDRLRVD